MTIRRNSTCILCTVSRTAKCRKFEKTKIDEVLRLCVIEQTKQNWLLHSAHSKGKRTLTLFRRFGEVQTPSLYEITTPFLKGMSALTRLASLMLSTLEANHVYWQTQIKDGNSVRTAFTMHLGLYRISEMTFGFCSAPGPFQPALDVKLSLIKWKCSLVFLDDIVIVSWNSDEHILPIGIVLSLLHKAAVALNLKPCNLFTEKIDSLGHAIRPGKLELSDHTSDTVWDLKPPRNVIKLNSFPYLCNLYRRFARNFARIVALLNKKLGEREQRMWDTLTQEERDAFVTSKDKLVTAAVLALTHSQGTLDPWYGCMR